MNVSHLTASVAVWGVLLTAAHAAEPPIEQWAIERADQQFSLTEHEGTVLINAFGNVRTRGQSGDRLEVFLVIQHHHDDAWQPQLASRVENGYLIVEVVDPGAGKVGEVPFKDRRRLDLSAFVPNTKGLELKTDDGLAESKGHRGKLDVHTVTGDINIKTKGTVTAHSTSGTITGYHQLDHWTGNSRYETQSGDVIIWLSNAPSVEATVDTAGSITTDFSIDIQGFSGSTRKIGRARIGDGGHQLDVSSAIGDIRLLRKIGFVEGKEEKEP